MKRLGKYILPGLLGAAAMLLILARCLVLDLEGQGGAGELPPGEAWTLDAHGAVLRASVRRTGENWVILLPGRGETGASLTALGDAYGARGWSTLIPALRGCGESGGGYRGPGTGAGAEVLAWIGRIREERPDARVVLHGRGTGANAALAAAGERPEGLAALVAEDPVPDPAMLGEACFPRCSVLLKWGVDLVLRLSPGRELPGPGVRRQTAGTRVPILFLTGETPVPAEAGILYRCAGKESRLLRTADPAERETAAFSFLTACSGSSQTP